MSRGPRLSAESVPEPLLPSPRQRRELPRSKVPSVDECVPRSGRLRGHERESARHLGAVLPPHLGFRRSLFAFADRLRGQRQADARLRYSGAGLPVPPFVPDLSIRSSWQGGGASLNRLLQSLVPIREHNLRIVRLPADSISSIDRRFSAGRPSSSSCWGRSPSPISPCCHRAAATESGAGRRFRVRQQSPRAFGAFAPRSLELHCYPDCDVEHTPLVAERVVRAGAGASCPDRRDEVVVIACPERDPLCRHEDRLRSSLPTPLNVLARLPRLFKAPEPQDVRLISPREGRYQPFTRGAFHP